MDPMQTFSCVAAAVEQFNDRRVGEIVHDLTVRQCEALADMVARTGAADLDAELRYVCAMCLAGCVVLFALTAGPCLFRRIGALGSLK